MFILVVFFVAVSLLRIFDFAALCVSAAAAAAIVRLFFILNKKTEWKKQQQ